MFSSLTYEDRDLSPTARVYLECRHGDTPTDSPDDDCRVCRAVWTEEPSGYSKPNPILVIFRAQARSAADFLWILGSPASSEVVYGAKESFHARSVLNRLAALS